MNRECCILSGAYNFHSTTAPILSFSLGVFVSVCLFVMQVTCLKQICATSTDLVNTHSTQSVHQLKQQLDIVKSTFVKNEAREATVIQGGNINNSLEELAEEN